MKHLTTLCFAGMFPLLFFNGSVHAVGEPVRVEKWKGTRCLGMRDKDPFDYARAERLFPESTRGTVDFELVAGQHDHGTLQVELQNGQGMPAIRMVLEPDGNLTVKDGYRMAGIMSYEPDRIYDFRIAFDVRQRLFHLYVDGNLLITRRFFAPVHSLERITFRTGSIRRFPDADTPTDQNFDVPDPGKIDEEAAYFIKSVRTSRIE